MFITFLVFGVLSGLGSLTFWIAYEGNLNDGDTRKAKHCRKIALVFTAIFVICLPLAELSYLNVLDVSQLNQ